VAGGSTGPTAIKYGPADEQCRTDAAWWKDAIAVEDTAPDAARRLLTGVDVIEVTEQEAQAVLAWAERKGMGAVAGPHSFSVLGALGFSPPTLSTIPQLPISSVVLGSQRLTVNEALYTSRRPASRASGTRSSRAVGSCCRV
jgi:hypothetical protein